MRSDFPAGATLAVEHADADTRADFIARTYMHLLGAVLSFVLIQVVLFKTGLIESVAAGIGQNWLIVLGAFILVSWLGSHLAHRTRSLPLQYAALAAIVVLEAAIFAPLLYVADVYADGAIQSAATVTIAAFLGLTAFAFITRKDFSFLRGFLFLAGMAALLFIVGGLVFGYTLGLGFMIAMVGLACASILYDTSNIIHHYGEHQYVAASLELFTSVALLFWYVLQLFMNRD